MAGVALAFAVLDIDDSASALGWVLAASSVPTVVFMLLGGAIADRLPRALVLRGCNLVQGVTQAVTGGWSSVGMPRSGTWLCCKRWRALCSP